MASVTVRKSPRTGEKFWQLTYTENGIQRRESLGPCSGAAAKTPREVELLRKAKEIELEGGPVLFIAAARFEDHLEQYLTWHARKYPTSHYRVKQICDQHFDPFRGRALSAIAALDIEGWVAGREIEVSPETVAKELRTLHAVLEKGVEWNRGILKNPADKVTPPRNLNSAPKRWYTAAERQKLYAMPRHGDTWKLMGNTGMRRAEALHLKWEEVHLKAREIWIVSTTAERTKSGVYREIPLNAPAVAALQSLRARFPEAVYVLPRMCKESLSRAFAIDVSRCGLRRIPGSLVHALRHCYGSALGSADVPARSLQILMGHASIATTEQYVNPDKKHLARHGRRVRV